MRLWSLIASVNIGALLCACSPDPACDNIKGSDLPSPDAGHIARVYETFCGAFGGASDGYSVAVRKRADEPERQVRVFIVFNHAPEVRWLDNKNLLVYVSGEDQVNLSKRTAKGVTVHYALYPSLAGGRIGKDLKAREQWADNFLH